jgi:hypothetical protein
MFKVFAFLVRKPGTTIEAFIDYYENHHVPLICSLAPPPTTYKRNYLKRGDKNNLEDGSIGFDVVTEQVWPDEATFRAWVGKLAEPGTAEKVDADERRFLDKSRYWAYVIDEHQTSK